MFDERIPIYDDFGRLVGWFIPADSGAWGCLAAAFLTILLSIVLLPFWFLWKGWEKWREGDKPMAVLAWGAAGVIFLIPAAAYWNNEQREQLWLRQREEARAAWEAEVARVIQNPADAVTLTRVASDIHPSTFGCDSSSTPEWCGRWRFAQYTITNHTKLRLDRTSSNLPAGDYCDVEWGRTFEVLEPGETRTIYCPTGYRFWEWETYPPICLYLVNWGWYKERFGYPTLVVCDGQPTIVTTS